MVTIRFRDGERDVPDHVATLMITLPTDTLTYDQAIKRMNDSLAREYLEKVQAKTVADHLARYGR